MHMVSSRQEEDFPAGSKQQIQKVSLGHLHPV